MVLENISVSKARKNPLYLTLFTFLITTAGIWLSYYVFPESASILSLAFVTMAFAPFIHRLFIVETSQEEETPGWSASFLVRHFDLIEIYGVIFAGIIIAYVFWFAMLPSSDCNNEWNCWFPEREAVFSEQEKVYKAITGVSATAKASISGTGRAVGELECKTAGGSSIEGCTIFIFTNNSIVLVLAILFSFIYGAGAVFLVGWNASVIGTFIGVEVVEKHIFAGIGRAAGYLPHGIWEIGGYFVGATAGGIITAALARKHYTEKQFEIIAKDALLLIFIAYAALLIGAVVEAILILQPSTAEVIILAEFVIIVLALVLNFILKKKQ